MAVPELLVQTAGSLIAVLVLAGLAWWMGLGGAPLLRDIETVHRVAAEIDDGFDSGTCALSQDQTAALVRDAGGRMMVIRRHGNRFAGRILGPRARAHLRHDTGQPAIEIDVGERPFGKTVLLISDPHPWADAINALHQSSHA